MKSLIITCTFIITFFSGFSQSTDFVKLDSLFAILEENDRFFGSVAISQGGEIIYQKALGSSDVENNLTNNSETKFRIGSISKTFTATLVMRAVELGSLSLDHTIEGYFPAIPNADKITIRQLLNHRSGISNFTDRSYKNWHTDPITPTALLDTIISKGFDFEPNTDYAYSNSNYVLLTFILEDAFGQSYDLILDQHIVKPLKLTNTYYGSAINPAQNEAKSYVVDSDWEEHSQDDMSIPLGAGGIVSTPTDLCLFIDALFDGKLISEESLKQMKPVGEEFYGFAMYETTFNEKEGWGHGGNIDAFASNLVYFEDRDISVALSCNGSNYGTHDVEVAMMSELFDQSYDLPSFDFVELSSEELDQYVGTYVTDDLPMDMIVSKEGNTLFLQVTGQSPGALTAEGDHKFSIMQHGVKMSFVPENNVLHFEQQGMSFELVRQTEEGVITNADDNTEQSSAPMSSDLDLYVGTYITDEIPVDIIISHKSNTLFLQVTGQSPGALTAEGDHSFSIEEYGVSVVFVPDTETMLFEQQGASFEFVRKAAN